MRQKYVSSLSHIWWHEKFDFVILEYGYVHNSANKCIYSKFIKDYGVIICLYVNNMLIISSNMKGLVDTKKYLSSRVKMKDLNEVNTILGIKGGLFINLITLRKF